MALHFNDGDHWQVAPDMATAEAWAVEAIDAARDTCDPEWPDTVESISIYEAPQDCEFPDEDGRQILKVEQCDVRDDPSGRCDYWCDYRAVRV